MVDVLGCLRFRIIRRLLSFGEEREGVDRPCVHLAHHECVRVFGEI